MILMATRWPVRRCLASQTSANVPCPLRLCSSYLPRSAAGSSGFAVLLGRLPTDDGGGVVATGVDEPSSSSSRCCCDLCSIN